MEDENVAPVYNKLQGVRVDNPSNGMFIVVRGSKVTKELVFVQGVFLTAF